MFSFGGSGAIVVEEDQVSEVAAIFAWCGASRLSYLSVGRDPGARLGTALHALAIKSICKLEIKIGCI